MSLVLDGLVKRFGSVTALDGISFEVPKGQVFGFLGANGAGKTTAMRIVLDILRPDAGRATWEGTPTTDVARETWGYLPEERGLYPRLAVLDQLVFFASLYGIPRDEAAKRATDWLARLRIPDYATRRAEELSKGNQQKVQLIAAIIHEPAVLLMDEPFVGLDPVNVALLKEAFEEMRQRGSTLIFSTHQMEMVEELCEAVALIDRGRLVLAGPIREVKRSTGRRVVRLALEGRSLDAPDSIPWLGSIPGVRIARTGQDYAELDVPNDVDPEIVLRTALAKGERVTNFLIADPSIEEIFIDRVGRPVSSEEERHLAGPAAAPAAPTAPPAPTAPTAPTA
ncbi:MAG TPA: ATP-binding cassette domain-containing protein [Candidatus Limnocylindrales bacterium]|nr:ATP-binding cassette domain-containing protein [Candidatus Limnocylindrales bacterium]